MMCGRNERMSTRCRYHSCVTRQKCVCHIGIYEPSLPAKFAEGRHPPLLHDRRLFSRLKLGPDEVSGPETRAFPNAELVRSTTRPGVLTGDRSGKAGFRGWTSVLGCTSCPPGKPHSGAAGTSSLITGWCGSTAGVRARCRGHATERGVDAWPVSSLADNETREFANWEWRVSFSGTSGCEIFESTPHLRKCGSTSPLTGSH